MAEKNWRDLLAELKRDADELVAERTQFAHKHQETLQASLPRDELREEALVRLRALAYEATTRWRPGDSNLDGFLELAIVDAHDATVDSIVGISTGVGAPAIALLRRQYELMLLLVAGWQKPNELEVLMQESLKKPFADDRYTAAAQAGLLGAVMPRPRRLRELCWGEGTDPEELSNAESIEAGLASFGHGGALAAASYLEDDRGHLENMLKLAKAFDPLVTGTTALISGSASQIADRLGFAQIYGDTDKVFSIAAVEKRDNDAVRAFDRAFPLALDVLWATFLGLNSLNGEFGTKLGARGNDPARRQLIILIDGLETAWLATEWLFRGRLSGCGTLIRRVFELSLEAQAWLIKQHTMSKRFEEEAARSGESDRTLPRPTAMIRWLHGTKSSVLQRQTYSTLCSVAHGGIQSQEYLLALEPDGLVVRPAPHFEYRHHRWLLGTLISAVDALLGAALVIAGRTDENIQRHHWGYLGFLRQAAADMPELGLIAGHLDFDGRETPAIE